MGAWYDVGFCEVIMTDVYILIVCVWVFCGLNLYVCVLILKKIANLRLSEEVERFINSTCQEKRMQIFYELKDRCFFDKEYQTMQAVNELLKKELEDLKKRSKSTIVKHKKRSLNE